VVVVCDRVSVRAPNAEHKQRRLVYVWRLQQLRRLGSVFESAARNRALLRVGVAFTAFMGAEVGVWVALLVYAYQHGGASAASVIALLQLVPGALFAPYLGGLSDRRRAGRVLLAGYAAFAGAMAIVAIVMSLGGPRLAVFALAPFVNLAVCVPRPAQAVLLPSIVESAEELAASNAGQGWLESAATLIAPIMVAVLLAAGGPALATAGMAALAGLAALLVVTIAGPIPFTSSADQSDGPEERALSSMRLIAAQPAALTLVAVLGTQYILMGALDLTCVVLAFGVLGMGQGGPGYLTAAFGAGGLLAILITAGLVGRRRLASTLIAGGLVAPCALLLLAAHATLASAFVLIALAGIGRSVFDVTGRTLLQRTAPPDLLARVFGLLESLLNAGLAVGVLLVPPLVALGGAEGALIGTGLVMLSVVAVSGRRLRKLDSAATVPLVEINLLRSIPLFAQLPAPALETLARALTPLSLPAGTIVIREGERGDRYYAIARGELDVERGGVPIVTRHRSEGVGEIALIRDTPRTATVTARTDVELYGLDREPFLLAMTGHAPASRAADTIVQQRLEELESAAPVGHAPPGNATPEVE
jgi:MFS family permease